MRNAKLRTHLKGSRILPSPCFYTSARKKDYYKSSSTKSIIAAIDRFLRSPPHNKPFSIISDPSFTEANKVLDAFVKNLRKTGKIAGVVHKRALSKEQLKKLFESSELGPADALNPQCPVTADGLVLPWPFFWKTGT